MMRQDAPAGAGARDLREQVGVPPDVIGVDGDAGAVAQLVAEVERLRKRVHAGAVGGIHRMQRLDRERHAGGARARQKRAKSVAHHGARAADVARAVRQSAADEHETFGAQGRGLVDGALVVVDGALAPRRIGRREHAAAAEVGDAEAVVAHDAGSFREPDLCHLVAPGRNRGDAELCASLDRLSQVELLAHGREVDGQSVKSHRRSRAYATPATANTWLMRLAASSGSRSTRALSASRNSSARCTTERALCWPPTMAKWSCRPLR